MSGPTPRRDPHLGELAAALVDGELGHDARDRALAHLARCADCRVEVAAQRKWKARLAGTDLPEAPTGLAARLLAVPDLGGSTPMAASTAPNRTASFRGGAGRDRRGTRKPSNRPGSAAPAGRPNSRRRIATAAAGGLTAFALSLAAVMILGMTDEPQRVAPAVNSYLVEHGRTSVGVPGADPVADGFAELTVGR